MSDFIAAVFATLIPIAVGIGIWLIPIYILDSIAKHISGGEE